MRRPVIYKAPPAVVEVWGPQPFYLVNHGPEYSGPGIIITEIGLTNTDLRLTDPFIGRRYRHVGYYRR